MNLIFDTSIIIHSNWHIYQLTDSRQHAFRVIDNINNIANRINPSATIHAALDSTEIFRRSIYPEYKANRDKHQFNMVEVNKVIIESSLNTYKKEGLEADDIMFLLSRELPDPWLVSMDNDCKLMITAGVTLYRDRLDQTITYNAKHLLLEQLLKITSGCKTDNVPSIKTKPLGPKGLLQHIESNEGKSIKELLELLLYDGRITDWGMNYDLVAYDLDTYKKYSLI